VILRAISAFWTSVSRLIAALQAYVGIRFSFQFSATRAPESPLLIYSAGSSSVLSPSFATGMTLLAAEVRGPSRPFRVLQLHVLASRRKSIFTPTMYQVRISGRRIYWTMVLPMLWYLSGRAALTSVPSKPRTAPRFDFLTLRDGGDHRHRELRHRCTIDRGTRECGAASWPPAPHENPLSGRGR
jgi:hypothetical protein